MNRIEECLAEYRGWCEKLGITAISDINRIVSEGKTNWLINISEIWQEQKISEIAKNIKDNISKKKIILISGPSSSGKTSFATRLQLHLKVLGINAVAISLDNYYIEKKDMPLNENGNPDLEALESIDYQRFNKNVEELINHGKTSIPKFDFQQSLIIDNARTLALNSDEVIIVEGIHGLNDKLTENIPDENKYKIYCSALMALSMDDGTRIKSRTTRMIRRLIRDYNFRNASYKYTLELWPQVEAGAQKNIFPYTDRADIIFNSSLLYELAVYKYPLNELFMDALDDERNALIVSQLSGLVNGFRSIEKTAVPPTSIVCEFVGGGTLGV